MVDRILIALSPGIDVGQVSANRLLSCHSERTAVTNSSRLERIIRLGALVHG